MKLRFYLLGNNSISTAISSVLITNQALYSLIGFEQYRKHTRTKEINEIEL